MLLRFSTGLIAAGGLAGMTSVLLVLFLSQARIFMAMSRDGLLPQGFRHGSSALPHAARRHDGHGRGDLRDGRPDADSGNWKKWSTSARSWPLSWSARPFWSSASSGRTPRVPSAARIWFVVAPLGILVNVR